MINLSRRPIQYNELVFDGIDMIENFDRSFGTKTEAQAYSYGNGSYVAYKRPMAYVRQQELSLTLKCDLRKLDCKQREYYKDWAIMNLLKPGRLWAIEGRQLLYADAYVQDISEPFSTERYSFNIDISLIIPEGVWHKPNPKAIFLEPYSPCNYLECQDFHAVGYCADCCVCDEKGKGDCQECACGCDGVQEDNSLCYLYNNSDRMDFFGQCSSDYKIIYNCVAAKRIFGDDALLGEKVCKADACKTLIAGRLYSDTVLDTRDVTITITGKMKNPRITVNNNTLEVNGEYDGTLTITPDMEVYYGKIGCCEKLIDDDEITIPDGSTFGYYIHHGYNRIIIELNDCCSYACAYFNVDSITI